MNFKVASDIFEKIPNLYIGVVVAKGVDNHREYPEIAEKLGQAVAAAQQRFADTAVKKAPEIVPYRDAFRALGLNPNRFPCSVEAMFSRISKGKDMPHINPLVDLNNAVSLEHVIPMGTHDLGRSTQDIEMRYAVEGDTFVPFGAAEAEAVPAGEAVYAVGHEVRTRRWTWRQSEHGKITEDTQYVFFPIDGFTDVNHEQVDQVRNELADILQHTFHCEVITGAVDKDHPACSLTI